MSQSTRPRPDSEPIVVFEGVPSTEPGEAIPPRPVVWQRDRFEDCDIELRSAVERFDSYDVSIVKPHHILTVPFKSLDRAERLFNLFTSETGADDEGDASTWPSWCDAWVFEADDDDAPRPLRLSDAEAAILDEINAEMSRLAALACGGDPDDDGTESDWDPSMYRLLSSPIGDFDILIATGAVG